MKKIIILCLFLSLTALSVQAEEMKAGTLCQKNEQIFFSCITHPKGKTVSLCGSSDLSATTGYLNYRFGTLEKIEMTYPPQAEQSRAAFHYGHYSHFQTDRTRVYFVKDNYFYSVFGDYENDGGATIDRKGIHLSTSVNDDGSGKETNYLCTGKIIYDLPKLENILSCDRDEIDCPHPTNRIQ